MRSSYSASSLKLTLKFCAVFRYTTRCPPLPSHREDTISKLCDKYPQKQGLVLSGFILIISQAAIGEPVGESEQDADAGDIAGRRPTNAVSITSAHVTRQPMVEAVI
ncbi:hypothetical protein NQZ68_033201 [Dissostichus eleginoides]|nr:hypothetical protein NQZ68_033201 [Dissostichus eleginoides]